jgi:spore maturation protein B
MLQIVAPLVGLMVGISMLRASGALDLLCSLLKPVTSAIGMPGEVLPLALLRPVSGSGSIAIVNDIFRHFGPDSPAGKIASVMMGSTETTFYTVAVYFGAVGVKKLRHTLKSALLADLFGMIFATFVARMLLM